MVGITITLALLSHVSAALTVLGLIPLILAVVMRRRAWTEAAIAAIAGLILYVPWLALQRFVDPAGDRLLDWQFAADFASTAARHPFLTVLIDQYRAVGLTGAIIDKLGNLTALVARPDLWLTSVAEPAWPHTVLGIARVAQATDLLCAVGPLTLGVLVLQSRRRRRQLAPVHSTAPSW